MFLISDETKCAVSDDPWEAGLFRSRPSPEASKIKGNEQKPPESSKTYPWPGRGPTVAAGEAEPTVVAGEA